MGRKVLTRAERQAREAAGQPAPRGQLKDPPADAADRILVAAAGGANEVGIAVACGVDRNTMRRWLLDYPELKEAIDRGRERERTVLHNKLYRLATEGSGKEAMVAAMFLLKARHGYREGEPVEQAGSRVNITFNLPAAQPMAEFVEIENADGTEIQRLPAKALVPTRRS